LEWEKRKKRKRNVVKSTKRRRENVARIAQRLKNSGFIARWLYCLWEDLVVGDVGHYITTYFVARQFVDLLWI